MLKSIISYLNKSITKPFVFSLILGSTIFAQNNTIKNDKINDNISKYNNIIKYDINQYPTNNSLQNPDSTITAPDDTINADMHTELEEIVVKSEKEKIPYVKEKGFKTIYYNDANKIAMSQYSGVFNTLPIYSRLRINNMDPKFTTIFYKDIPLIIDNTQLHGGISSFNADLTDLKIKKTAYSSKYSSIGGVMELDFKNNENNFIVSSNILERYLIYEESFNINDDNSEKSKNKKKLMTKNSIRNIEIPGFLERTIKETKIFPNIYEFMNNTIIFDESSETEAVIRFSITKGSFDEENNLKLNERSSNRLVILRHSESLNENINLAVAISNEKNDNNISYVLGDEENKIKTYNSNTSIIGSIKTKNLTIGGRTFFLRNTTLKETKSKKISEIYAEYKHITGNLLLEPSFRISKDDVMTLTSQGIIATLFFNNSSLSIGYNHPTNMLVVDNSSGEKNYELSYLGNQFGDHYISTLNFSGKDIKLEEILSDLEVSYYYKYFHAYREDKRPDKGIVKGIDIMIRNKGDFNYTIKFSKGDATLNGVRMNEAVNEILSIDLGIPLTDRLFLNNQYVFNGGYTVRIKSDKSTHLIGKAHYLSTSLTYKFNIGQIEGDVSITFFNILKFLGYNNIPEFARYKIADNVKSIKMPGLGDLRISLKF
ncbi:MAG: hypothetical protein KatS3mg002_0477 [Candidatus Woesearchaeota archaeon]|nr:MAG: hypothetical protein KatS3mg002_0477 [Candidatus Woesearchaeota archaeon]